MTYIKGLLSLLMVKSFETLATSLANSTFVLVLSSNSQITSAKKMKSLVIIFLLQSCQVLARPLHPDPNLVPIIDKLLTSDDVEKTHDICQLFAGLESLADAETREKYVQQIEDTLDYIQDSLRRNGLNQCALGKSQKLANDQPANSSEESSTITFNSIDEESQAEFGDYESLCDECQVDYADSETVKFNAANDRKIDDEAMNKAKGKIIR